jgi:hypothetical protein
MSKKIFFVIFFFLFSIFYSNLGLFYNLINKKEINNQNYLFKLFKNI